VHTLCTRSVVISVSLYVTVVWESGRGLRCFTDVFILRIIFCLKSLTYFVLDGSTYIMYQRLIIRVCFKWSSWILIGFLLFYIYVIALYFLYSNQSRVEKYDIDYELEEHPIHDHLLEKKQLPEGFSSWTEVISNILTRIL